MAVYLDDMTLACEDAVTSEIYSTFTKCLAAIDLEVNTKKTQIWRPEGTAPTDGALAAQWEQQGRPEGVVICGQPLDFQNTEGPAEAEASQATPMGTAAYLSLWLEEHLRRYKADCDRLGRILETGGPMAGLKTTTRRMLHICLLRTLPASVSVPWAQSIDAINKAFIERRLGLEHIQDTEWQILTLPIRHGGLGLASAVVNRPVLACSYHLQARARDHERGEMTTGHWEKKHCRKICRDSPAEQFKTCWIRRWRSCDLTGCVKQAVISQRHGPDTSSRAWEWKPQPAMVPNGCYEVKTWLWLSAEGHRLLADEQIVFHLRKQVGRSPTQGQHMACTNFDLPRVTPCGVNVHDNPAHPYSCARRAVMARRHRVRDWIAQQARQAGWRADIEQSMSVGAGRDYKRVDVLATDLQGNTWGIDVTFATQTTKLAAPRLSMLPAENSSNMGLRWRNLALPTASQ